MTIVRVRADELQRSPRIRGLVAEFRSAADAFIFLSGGASKMPASAKRRLVKLLDALVVLAATDLRFAVGDGGTKAGLMEAAGRARRRSGDGFLLLGVAPAPEILPIGRKGRTPIEPRHSHLVAIDNPDWTRRKRKGGWRPADGYWGAEVAPMYALFARLARGRRAVTIVANGGSVTLQEVRRNIRQRRPMIVIAGSGRAADAIVSVLRRTPIAQADDGLRAAAEKLDLARHRHLFAIFPLRLGPRRLAQVVARHLSI
jgi:hypothetical protein